MILSCDYIYIYIYIYILRTYIKCELLIILTCKLGSKTIVVRSFIKYKFIQACFLHQEVNSNKAEELKNKNELVATYFIVLLIDSTCFGH